jgi:hypothetical protein
MAASLQDMLNQMTGGNLAANPRRRQNAVDPSSLTGGSQASSQSPGQSMLGSVLSNTLYQQLMPLLNTLNARRISNVITKDQYYNTPNNYTYTPGDTNPPPTNGGTTTGGTGSTTFTPINTVKTNIEDPGVPLPDPVVTALNQIYQTDFGRGYNPATDSYWANQIKSGAESLSNMDKLKQDISSGARNVTGGTQDLTYEDLNNIYHQFFGRAYNPSTDSYWANQISSGKENINNPSGIDKLAADIREGAQNTAAGQDLTASQSVLGTYTGGVFKPTGALHPDRPTSETTAQGTTTGGTTTTGGGTTTPTPRTITGPPGPVGSDGYSDLLNKIYQTDFNRPYNPATDSYWAQQIDSNPSLASNPVQLANTIAGGAAQGSSDAAAYQKAMTVNPVTDNGKSINPAIPSGVGPSYVAMLNAANADPAVQAALNGAVDANIPGFTVRRDGGPVHAHKTHPFYYYNGRWHQH